VLMGRFLILRYVGVMGCVEFMFFSFFLCAVGVEVFVIGCVCFCKRFWCNEEREIDEYEMRWE
jgi:hypothetical protein